MINEAAICTLSIVCEVANLNPKHLARNLRSLCSSVFRALKILKQPVVCLSDVLGHRKGSGFRPYLNPQSR